MPIPYSQLLSPFLWIPILALALAGLAWRWMKRYGLKIGSAALIARIAWLLPFVCMLFPRADTVASSTKLLRQKVHLFVDESPSMSREFKFDRKKRSLEIQRSLKNLCRELSCEVAVTTLKDVANENKTLHFSKLSEQLEPWVAQTRGDPWIVLSDGEDSEGLLNTPQMQKEQVENPKGVMVSFAQADPNNLAISKISLAPLAFENTPLSIRVEITRAEKSDPEKISQLQIYDGSELLAAENISFPFQQIKTSVDLPLKALTRGQHRLKFVVTPTPQEKQIWDNERTKTIDVIANTIGVLHILGAPSWDGRLLRRFFKDEPKFDLISFFILRDPWDMQAGSERELSLIPFPTERLFTQELPHFQLVVMQNFSIFQFLSPTHQEALVQYVLSGGALLFVGGTRALNEQDLRDSPLKRIFPFNVDQRKALSGENFFHEDKRIDVTLAERKNLAPSAATIYDDFSQLLSELPDPWSTTGSYVPGLFKLKGDAVTPLLVTKDGDPFLFASFPGKGRALWLLTDSLWTLAMNGALPQGRNLYNEILAKSIRWLTQRSWESPLQVSQVDLQRDEQKNVRISADLIGPALLDPTTPQFLQMESCGQRIAQNQIKTSVTAEKLHIEGSFPQKYSPELQCSGTITYKTESGGEEVMPFFAETLHLVNDDDFTDGSAFLRHFAATHGAFLLNAQERSTEAHLHRWLATFMKDDLQPQLKENEESATDRYWIFRTWWVYLLILCLPVEAWLRTIKVRFHPE